MKSFERADFALCTQVFASVAFLAVTQELASPSNGKIDAELLARCSRACSLRRDLMKEMTGQLRIVDITWPPEKGDVVAARVEESTSKFRWNERELHVEVTGRAWTGAVEGPRESDPIEKIDLRFDGDGSTTRRRDLIAGSEQALKLKTGAWIGARAEPYLPTDSVFFGGADATTYFDPQFVFACGLLGEQPDVVEVWESAVADMRFRLLLKPGLQLLPTDFEYQWKDELGTWRQLIKWTLISTMDFNGITLPKESVKETWRLIDGARRLVRKTRRTIELLQPGAAPAEAGSHEPEGPVRKQSPFGLPPESPEEIRVGEQDSRHQALAELPRAGDG